MTNQPIHNDAYLVKKLQLGDKSALTVLVRKWHKLFCEKSFWLVKDKQVAKDIAQESWVIIIDKIDTLQKPERFKFWAYRIVVNKSMDYLRSSTNNKTTSYSQNIIDEVDDNSEREQQKKRLLVAIKSLPQQQKIVIQLFYTQSYSLKQISEILDISVGTVKSRLFHAREKLKTILKTNRYEN
ncbi:RNA polymerase sigma factor [Winogradskyella jejuensis]|uniref:RNA polymerase sigma-70 factor, ECF subfamily n=1 Tax=Winogradskyella jejuensis TaxID=1089305 RepID=A0A1M5TE71_9FLAO|nr:sigma-70 family RNA polymerase sigma factor [Winogradskyella jejuensis]SHH49008.1 RNA polymerase sigma-70 factor, ECF subfamily [Winogradskyella jejuensis]